MVYQITKLGLLLCLCSVSMSQRTSNPMNVWADGSAYTVTPGTVEASECDSDVFPDKIEVKFAQFAVTYKTFYKLVEDTYSNNKYVLIQRGCESKAVEAADASYTKIVVPVTAVSVPSSTYLPSIEFMDERKSIRAVNGVWSESACLHKQVEDGHTKSSMAYYNSTTARWENEGTWTPLGYNIDVTFDDGFLSASLAAAMPKATVSDIREDTFLEVSEWNKYFSLFYNKEKMMETFAEDARARWTCHAKKVETITPKKKVLWMSHSSWTPAGYQVGLCAAGNPKRKYCELIRAAGAEPINELAATASSLSSFAMDSFTSTSKVGIDAASMKEFAMEADVIIFESIWCAWGATASQCHDEFNTLINTNLAGVKAVTDGQVWDIGGSLVSGGGTDMFTRGHVEPDVMLEDLIKVVYPDSITHDIIWLRKMDPANGIAGNAVMCTSTITTNCHPDPALLHPQCTNHEAHTLLHDGCTITTDSGASALSVSAPLVFLSALFVAIASLAA